MKKILFIFVGILLLVLTACGSDVSSSQNEEVSHLIEVIENSINRINDGEGEFPTEIANENAKIIYDILDGYEFVEGSSDCLCDFALNLGGRYIKYHSECGTVIECLPTSSLDSIEPDAHLTEKSCKLLDNDKATLNQIINKTLSIKAGGGEVIKAKIIKLYENSMLVATEKPNHTADLISVPYDNADNLIEGDVVQILFDGYYNATYPAQIGKPEQISLFRREGDLVGLYLDVIIDLLAHDQALNEDMEKIVLDLEKAENLTSAEKSAISHLLSSQQGVECIFSSYEQLVKDGQIKEGGHFDKGIIISVSNFESAVCQPNFKFNLMKWRSPLGAYIFSDILVTLGTDFKFNYEIGAHAIS